MSTRECQDQGTMHPWLERLETNQPIIASIKLKETATPNTEEKKRKEKEKEKENKLKEEKKNTPSKKSTQQKLREYLADTGTIPIHEDTEEGDTRFGDDYTKKAENSIRLWFTNPCGIGLDHRNSKSHASLKFIKMKSKADLIGLAETNVNWKLLSNNSSLYSRLKNNWKNFRSITSNNILEEMGKCQRGGTCSFVIDQLSHRTSQTGKDPSGLGRWTWIEFQGANELRSRVYTAYRTGHKPAKSKLTTVYDQQMRFIRRNNLNCEPRDLFDKDIMTEIEKQQANNIQIVLMIDANENIETGEFTKEMEKRGLYSVYKRYIRDQMPATHHTGSYPISTIYAPMHFKIIQAGILQKGKGYQSYHRNMYVDLDSATFLGGYMYKVLPPSMKMLQLNDPRVYKTFIKKLRNHLIEGVIALVVRWCTNHASGHWFDSRWGVI